MSLTRALPWPKATVNRRRIPLCHKKVIHRRFHLKFMRLLVYRGETHTATLADQFQSTAFYPNPVGGPVTDTNSGAKDGLSCPVEWAGESQFTKPQTSSMHRSHPVRT